MESPARKPDVRSLYRLKAIFVPAGHPWLASGSRPELLQWKAVRRLMNADGDNDQCYEAQGEHCISFDPCWTLPPDSSDLV